MKGARYSNIYFKVAIAIFICIIIGISTGTSRKIYDTNVKNISPLEQITQDKIITQEFTTNRKVDSIYFLFGTYNRKNTSHYTLNIKKDNSIIFNKTIDASTLRDNEYYKIKLNSGLDIGSYNLEIYSSDAIDGNAITLYAGIGERSSKTLKINEQKSNLSIKLQYDVERNIPLYLILISLILLLTGLILYKRNYEIENLVVILIIFYGILFCLFNPIIDSPDEYPHFYKAVATSDFKTFNYESYNYDISESYFEVVNNRDNTIFTNDLKGSISNSKFKLKKIDVVGMAVYAPWGYIPQAIAIKLGTLLKLPILVIFYLGRLMNLMLYAFLSFYAVKISPKYKMFLASVALMPMAIFISSSYNQDSTTYGLLLLMIAWLIKLYNNNEKTIKCKTIMLFTILSVIISTLKFPYMLFSLLFLFIPGRTFINKNIHILGKASAIASNFLLTLLYFLKVSTQFVEFRIDGANSIEQLKFIMNNIIYVMLVFMKAMFYHMGDYFGQLFTFGWLSYSTPSVVIYLYLVFLILVGIFYTENVNISKSSKIFIATIYVVIYGTLHLILYMTWTPVGAADVNGVQGRYLVPLFTLIPILKNNSMTIKYEENTQINILFIANLFLLASFLTMIFRYY